MCQDVSMCVRVSVYVHSFSPCVSLPAPACVIQSAWLACSLPGCTGCNVLFYGLYSSKHAEGVHHGCIVGSSTWVDRSMGACRMGTWVHGHWCIQWRYASPWMYETWVWVHAKDRVDAVWTCGRVSVCVHVSVGVYARVCVRVCIYVRVYMTVCQYVSVCVVRVQRISMDPRCAQVSYPIWRRPKLRRGLPRPRPSPSLSPSTHLYLPLPLPLTLNTAQVRIPITSLPTYRAAPGQY